MKKHWVIAGSAIVIILLAIFGISGEVKAPIVPGGIPDIASSTEATSTGPLPMPTTTTSVVATVKPFPINVADTLASWDFKGIYNGNAVLTAQATSDITKLTGLLGKGQYDNYDLYNGIANDYGMLGNGQEAYQYYNRSIQIHADKGLAYTNLAHLMDELGAYHTAADAYAKAVAVEPSTIEYHIEQLTYLTRQFPQDTSLVAAAFTTAAKQFGDTPSILMIEAPWLAEQGRYADAIKAWQTVKTLSPGRDTTAIDAEIARLQAKQ